MYFADTPTLLLNVTHLGIPSTVRSFDFKTKDKLVEGIDANVYTWEKTAEGHNHFQVVMLGYLNS